MISELERQRVTQFQKQRERYLNARQKAIQPKLAPDRELLSNRYPFFALLLVTPYVLLAVAGALDLLYLVTGNTLWSTISFAVIPAGVLGSIGAVSIGLRDWFVAPAGCRARGVGAWYAIGTALLVTIFTQSWVARFDTGDAGGLGVILGFMGAAVALLTGWLLSEYLDRLNALEPAPGSAAESIDDNADLHHVDEIVEERRIAHA